MGRGLAAILTVPDAAGAPPDLRTLPLDAIEPNPNQPRRRFDDDGLAALADSLRERGVLQPVLVRPRPGGTFGAREAAIRLAAAAAATAVPAYLCFRLVSPYAFQSSFWLNPTISHAYRAALASQQAALDGKYLAPPGYQWLLSTRVWDPLKNLVVWQLGSNDAVWRGIAENAKEMLADAVMRLKAANADVVLVDLQYAPLVLLTSRHARMEKIITEVAQEQNVGQFPRFTLMKRAIDGGVSGLVGWDGLHKTAELVVYAIRNGLVNVP
jgi:hypothetical protein